MILQRNILILYNINYYQQFIECYKELSEAICILSSETFAVILYMLLLIRLQSRAFINWGKVVAPIMVHCQSPSIDIYGLVDLV